MRTLRTGVFVSAPLLHAAYRCVGARATIKSNHTEATHRHRGVKSAVKTYSREHRPATATITSTARQRMEKKNITQRSQQHTSKWTPSCRSSAYGFLKFRSVAGQTLSRLHVSSFDPEIVRSIWCFAIFLLLSTHFNNLIFQIIFT